MTKASGLPGRCLLTRAEHSLITASCFFLDSSTLVLITRVGIVEKK